MSAAIARFGAPLAALRAFRRGRVLILGFAAWAILLAPAALSGFQIPQQLKNQPLPIPGHAGPSQSKQKSAVLFVAPGEVTVPAGKPTRLDLYFHIADGLHINSHAPHDKALIPTRLAVLEPQGIHIVSVAFPPGAEYALTSAPAEKLSVYTGDFVLHARLTAQPGDHLLQSELRYQACDANACMPPQELPFAVAIIAK